MTNFDLVYDAIPDARGIAFDTCHKIYVLLDDEQIEKMRGYGYGEEPGTLFTKDEMSDGEMFDTVKSWYDESCSLRFVQSIKSVPAGVDANEGFEDLISQFEDDEEECEDCLEKGCYGACYVDEEDEEDEDD